jgi:sugar lactone lactonase YvrE
MHQIKPFTFLWVLISAMVLAPLASRADDPSNRLAELDAEAVKAYRAKDYARFLALEKQSLALAPSNARVLYNVACGEGLQGNAPEAVRLLAQLLTRKLDLGAETDEDFSSIRKSPEWAAFLSRLALLRKPIARSEVAFRLLDPALVATGIAIDPRTGDAYIASVRQRKIVRRTKEGVISDFVSTAKDGLMAVDSLDIDPARRLLFASCGAAPFMTGYTKEDSGRSGLFVFDLTTGKLVRKAMLPADGKRHILNALVLDREGNAYVSDSGPSGVYRLDQGTDQLKVFIAQNVFRSTQGLALSDDEKTLFVADYSDGVWAVDMASKERRRLEEPANAWLAGLDGLTRVHGGFIAVQIGVRPERVLRLRLDKQARRITTVEILEMNHPEYQGPIQGAVSGGAFFYVANSQLDLGDETGAFAADRARATVVLRLPL